MDNNESETSKKQEEISKPRSRLLLMKDRLKSQRKLTNHGDKPSKTDEKSSKSGDRKKSGSKVSKSHSFTEADKQNGQPSAKKSLFGKHKKAQSAEMELNGQGTYLSNPQGDGGSSKNPSNKNNTNKKPSDPLRFFTSSSSSSSKMLKSKSFDLNEAPLAESGESLKLQQNGYSNNSKKADGRLNKSLELDSGSSIGGGERKLSGILKTANGVVQKDKDQSAGQSSTSASSSSGRSLRSAIGSHFGFGFHGNSSNKNSKSPPKESGKKHAEKSDYAYQIHRKIETQPDKKSSSSIQYTLKPKIKQEVPLVKAESSSGSEGGFDNQSQRRNTPADSSPDKPEKWKGSSEYLERCDNGTTTNSHNTDKTTQESTSLSLAVTVSAVARTGRVPLPKASNLGLASSHSDKERTYFEAEAPRNSMAAFHGRGVSADNSRGRSVSADDTHGRSVSAENPTSSSSSISRPPQPQDRAPYLKMDFREGGHISRKSLSPDRSQNYPTVAPTKSGPRYTDVDATRSNSTSSRTSQDVRQDFPDKRSLNLVTSQQIPPPPPNYEKVNRLREGPYESVRITEQGMVVKNNPKNVPRQASWRNGYVEIHDSNHHHHDYSRVPPAEGKVQSNDQVYSTNPVNKNGPGHTGYYSTLPNRGGSGSSNARLSHLHPSKEPVYYRHRPNQIGEQTNRNSAIYHSNQSRPKPIIRQSQSLEDLLDSDCHGNNLRKNPNHPINTGQPLTDPYNRPNSKESVNSNSTSQASFDNYPPRNTTRGGTGGAAAKQTYSSEYKLPRDNSCPPALDYQRVDYQNNNNTGNNDHRIYSGQNPNAQNNSRRNLQLTDVVKPPPFADDTNKQGAGVKHASQYAGVNNSHNNSFSSASDVSQYQDRIDALKTEFKKHFDEDNNNEVLGRVKDFSDLSNKLDAHIIMNENEGVYHVRKELGNIPDVARTGPTHYEKQSSNNNYEYLNKLNRDKSNSERQESMKEYSGGGVYSVQSGEHKLIPYNNNNNKQVPYNNSNKQHEGDYVSSAQIQALKAASGDYAVLYQGRVVPESGNYASIEDMQPAAKHGTNNNNNSGNYSHRNGSNGNNDPNQRYSQARGPSQQPQQQQQPPYGDYGKSTRLERISEGDYDTLKERHLDKISEGSQESVEEMGSRKVAQSSSMKRAVSTPPHKKNGLKVTNPDDLKGQTGGERVSTPSGSVRRRHTVTTGRAEQEFQGMRRNEEYTDTKENLMDHLATKFPHHSQVIRGRLYDQLPYSSRQPGRAPIHPLQSGRNESYYEAVRDEDRLSTKSESESPAHGGGQFVRGGVLRSSLPIVRSPNKSLDKPMGLVFLIYRHETKRSLLPNEVTSLDTIRALFVRAFCDQLSMRWFDGQGRKIYVMDPGTNVYYELEDLRDIKDRSVLKIYEPDFPFNMRSPSLSPHPQEAIPNSHHGYESDSSVRSAPPMVPRSPMHQSHPPPGHRAYAQDVASKTSSLPVQSNYAYHQPKCQFTGGGGGGPGGVTVNPAPHTNGPPSSQPVNSTGGGGWGSPTHQRSHGSPPTQGTTRGGLGSPPTQGGRGGVGSPTTHRPLSQVSPLARPAHGSPVRSPVHQNNRHSVAYLPPNSADFHSNQLPQSQSYHDYQEQRSSGSVTPSVEDSETRERMQRMEAQLASLTAMMQSAVVLKADSGAGSRPSSARSNSSLVSDTSCSIKSSKENEDGSDIDCKPLGTMFPSINPASKLRNHYSQVGISLTDSISDSTTPTIHSPSLSSYQGVSDSSTATPQPLVSIEMQTGMRALYQRARELRTEVNKLRRLQISNSESMQETIYQTFNKIKTIIEKVPGADEQPVRHQRQEVNQHMYSYQEEAHRVESDLSDLALSVDDLRQDVLTKGCRINKDEIQTMALTLSNISKSLGDLKCKFPHLQQNVKSVLAGEMEVVVREEKFLQKEPENLDDQLKKCEKVMKVLLTLKRLGNVQEAKPLVQPNLMTQRSPNSGDRRRILENIEAMAPDHGTRVASAEAAEAARERKKKIQSNAESMRFEKALDHAQKQLRNTNIPVVSTKQRSSQQETQPEEQQLDKDDKDGETGKVESPGSPKIPLTDTTKRLSKVNQSKDSHNSGSEGINTKRREGGSDIAPEKLKPSPDEDISGIKTQIHNSGISSPTTAGANANTSGSSIQSQISRLSTFGLPGLTSTPNGEAPPPSQQPNGKATSPNGGNKSSHNNNGSITRVSFSSTVTEIPSLSTSHDGNVKPKKVPPPPPPRKSSRCTVLSPSANKTAQKLGPPSGPPPTYENIENFPKGGQSVPSKIPSSPPSRIPQVGSVKPMTRYQHELASGIYANINRPDLQEQKIKPMEAVKTASLDHSPDEVEESGESESSSEESQGTVKRRPASKETSPQPPPYNQDNGSSADQSKHSITTEEIGENDNRKFPPPPPVRKTSALSQNATEIQTSQSGASTKLSPDGGSKIPKMSSGFLQKKLSNGELKAAKSARDKQYNETEIY